MPQKIPAKQDMTLDQEVEIAYTTAQRLANDLHKNLKQDGIVVFAMADDEKPNEVQFLTCNVRQASESLKQTYGEDFFHPDFPVKYPNFLLVCVNREGVKILQGEVPN